jgi:hypothetical protein
MTDDERAVIMNKAYDTLERLKGFDVREVDPLQPDAMDEWQRLRDRYREPEPKPRQTKLDTQVQAARDAAWARWDAWADSRIERYLDETYSEVIAQFTSEYCRPLRQEIKQLRKDLDAARVEIKHLKAAAKALDVRPLFEMDPE